MANEQAKFLATPVHALTEQEKQAARISVCECALGRNWTEKYAVRQTKKVLEALGLDHRKSPVVDTPDL